MADHLWTVLCTQAIENKDTRGFSLIETFDRVTLSSDDVERLEAELALNEHPVLPTRMALVTAWRRSEKGTDPSEVRIRLLDPRGTAMSENIEEIRSSVDNRGLVQRIVLRMDLLPFRGLGKYQFKVASRSKGARWRGVACLPLELRVGASS